MYIYIYGYVYIHIHILCLAQMPCADTLRECYPETGPRGQEVMHASLRCRACSSSMVAVSLKFAILVVGAAAVSQCIFARIMGVTAAPCAVMLF